MTRSVSRSLIALAASLVSAGCASVPGAPAETGRIEFVLDDSEIPSEPLGGPEPPTCHIVFSLDGVTLLDTELKPYPVGPPYRLEKTFRFPVEPGRYLARVRYVGCRFVGDQADAIEAEMEVAVVERHTTRVHFDGPVLRWEGFFPIPSRSL